MLILPLTPFIGRELELTELLGLFKTTRLITVTGPGGSGKTRLAMELSSRCALPGELVTVVGLDVVNDPALVADAVRVALGVRSVPDTPTDEQVITELATSPRLLILDNCEHMATAVRKFVEAALSAVPNLRVLTTSRIVLNVPGEQVWAIPALEMPAPNSGPDDVSRSDAGQLFIERARRSQPGYYLDNAAAASVVRICELLDGLPLALELAAAWSSTLSTIELADRLSASLALLNSDDRGHGRNRTLRSMAEWSDALLDPEDRIVLAALSVFAGPFTIGDAEHVAGGDDPLDVVHSLRRLVDSSWVVALPGDETAYGMLNTLRDYGRELLDRGGQEAAVRRRHAQAFTEKAEASEAELAGADQYTWRARMERAAGDFALALDWATKQADDDLSLRLVASLWRWWYTSGRIAEGRAWVTAALARSRSASPSLRARALYTSAILAAENGDYDTAQAHAQSAQRAFNAIGDHARSSRSSTILGNVAKYRGDVAAAMRHLSDAVTGQQTLGDDWATAVALQNLAAFVIDQGDLGHGRELMEDSLTLKRRVGDRRSLAYGLINLSDLLVRERDLDHARTTLAEAAGIAADVSDERLGAFVEHNLGDVCAAANELAAAALHYGNALDGFRHVRDHRDVALAMCSLGRTLIEAGKRNHGLAMLRESEWLAAEIGDELRLSEARSALASAENAPATRTLPDGLTARQAEILTLLASGLSNRDISTRLTLSTGTVERHLANVYRKLGVTNRVGATRYALAHGLGSPTKP